MALISFCWTLSPRFISCLRALSPWRSVSSKSWNFWVFPQTLIWFPELLIRFSAMGVVVLPLLVTSFTLGFIFKFVPFCSPFKANSKSPKQKTKRLRKKSKKYSQIPKTSMKQNVSSQNSSLPKPCSTNVVTKLPTYAVCICFFYFFSLYFCLFFIYSLFLFVSFLFILLFVLYLLFVFFTLCLCTFEPFKTFFECVFVTF